MDSTGANGRKCQQTTGGTSPTVSASEAVVVETRDENGDPVFARHLAGISTTRVNVCGCSQREDKINDCGSVVCCRGERGESASASSHCSQSIGMCLVHNRGSVDSPLEAGEETDLDSQSLNFDEESRKFFDQRGRRSTINSYLSDSVEFFHGDDKDKEGVKEQRHSSVQSLCVSNDRIAADDSGVVAESSGRHSQSSSVVLKHEPTNSRNGSLSGVSMSDSGCWSRMDADRTVGYPTEGIESQTSYNTHVHPLCYSQTQVSSPTQFTATNNIGLPEPKEEIDVKTTCDEEGRQTVIKTVTNTAYEKQLDERGVPLIVEFTQRCVYKAVYADGKLLSESVENVHPKKRIRLPKPKQREEISECIDGRGRHVRIRVVFTTTYEQEEDDDGSMVIVEKVQKRVHRSFIKSHDKKTLEPRIKFEESIGLPEPYIIEDVEELVDHLGQTIISISTEKHVFEVEYADDHTCEILERITRSQRRKIIREGELVNETSRTIAGEEIVRHDIIRSSQTNLCTEPSDPDGIACTDGSVLGATCTHPERDYDRSGHGGIEDHDVIKSRLIEISDRAAHSQKVILKDGNVCIDVDELIRFPATSGKVLKETFRETCERNEFDDMNSLRAPKVVIVIITEEFFTLSGMQYHAERHVKRTTRSDTNSDGEVNEDKAQHMQLIIPSVIISEYGDSSCDIISEYFPSTCTDLIRNEPVFMNRGISSAVSLDECSSLLNKTSEDLSLQTTLLENVMCESYPREPVSDLTQSDSNVEMERSSENGNSAVCCAGHTLNFDSISREPTSSPTKHDSTETVEEPSTEHNLDETMHHSCSAVYERLLMLPSLTLDQAPIPKSQYFTERSLEKWPLSDDSNAAQPCIGIGQSAQALGLPVASHEMHHASGETTCKLNVRDDIAASYMEPVNDHDESLGKSNLPHVDKPDFFHPCVSSLDTVKMNESYDSQLQCINTEEKQAEKETLQVDTFLSVPKETTSPNVQHKVDETEDDHEVDSYENDKSSITEVCDVNTNEDISVARSECSAQAQANINHGNTGVDTARFCDFVSEEKRDMGDFHTMCNTYDFSEMKGGNSVGDKAFSYQETTSNVECASSYLIDRGSKMGGILSKPNEVDTSDSLVHNTALDVLYDTAMKNHSSDTPDHVTCKGNVGVCKYSVNVPSNSNAKKVEDILQTVSGGDSNDDCSKLEVEGLTEDKDCPREKVECASDIECALNSEMGVVSKVSDVSFQREVHDSIDMPVDSTGLNIPVSVRVLLTTCDLPDSDTCTGSINDSILVSKEERMVENLLNDMTCRNDLNDLFIPGDDHSLEISSLHDRSEDVAWSCGRPTGLERDVVLCDVASVNERRITFHNPVENTTSDTSSSEISLVECSHYIAPFTHGTDSASLRNVSREKEEADEESAVDEWQAAKHVTESMIDNSNICPEMFQTAPENPCIAGSHSGDMIIHDNNQASVVNVDVLLESEDGITAGSGNSNDDNLELSLRIIQDRDVGIIAVNASVCSDHESSELANISDCDTTACVLNSYEVSSCDVLSNTDSDATPFSIPQDDGENQLSMEFIQRIDTTDDLSEETLVPARGNTANSSIAANDSSYAGVNETVVICTGNLSEFSFCDEGLELDIVSDGEQPDLDIHTKANSYSPLNEYSCTVIACENQSATTSCVSHLDRVGRISDELGGHYHSSDRSTANFARHGDDLHVENGSQTSEPMSALESIQGSATNSVAEEKSLGDTISDEAVDNEGTYRGLIESTPGDNNERNLRDVPKVLHLSRDESSGDVETDLESFTNCDDDLFQGQESYLERFSGETDVFESVIVGSSQFESRGEIVNRTEPVSAGLFEVESVSHLVSHLVSDENVDSAKKPVYSNPSLYSCDNDNNEFLNEGVSDTAYYRSSQNSGRASSEYALADPGVVKHGIEQAYDSMEVVHGVKTEAHHVSDVIENDDLCSGVETRASSEQSNEFVVCSQVPQLDLVNAAGVVEKWNHSLEEPITLDDAVCSVENMNSQIYSSDPGKCVTASHSELSGPNKESIDSSCIDRALEAGLKESETDGVEACTAGIFYGVDGNTAHSNTHGLLHTNSSNLEDESDYFSIQNSSSDIEGKWRSVVDIGTSRKCELASDETLGHSFSSLPMHVCNDPTDTSFVEVDFSSSVGKGANEDRVVCLSGQFACENQRYLCSSESGTMCMESDELTMQVVELGNADNVSSSRLQSSIVNPTSSNYATPSQGAVHISDTGFTEVRDDPSGIVNNARCCDWTNVAEMSDVSQNVEVIHKSDEFILDGSQDSVVNSSSVEIIDNVNLSSISEYPPVLLSADTGSDDEVSKHLGRNSVVESPFIEDIHNVRPLSISGDVPMLSADASVINKADSFNKLCCIQGVHSGRDDHPIVDTESPKRQTEFVYGKLEDFCVSNDWDIGNVPSNESSKSDDVNLTTGLDVQVISGEVVNTIHATSLRTSTLNSDAASPGHGGHVVETEQIKQNKNMVVISGVNIDPISVISELPEKQLICTDASGLHGQPGSDHCSSIDSSSVIYSSSLVRHFCDKQDVSDAPGNCSNITSNEGTLNEYMKTQVMPNEELYRLSTNIKPSNLHIQDVIRDHEANGPCQSSLPVNFDDNGDHQVVVGQLSHHRAVDSPVDADSLVGSNVYSTNTQIDGEIKIPMMEGRDTNPSVLGYELNDHSDDTSSNDRLTPGYCSCEASKVVQHVYEDRSDESRASTSVDRVISDIAEMKFGSYQATPARDQKFSVSFDYACELQLSQNENIANEACGKDMVQSGDNADCIWSDKDDNPIDKGDETGSQDLQIENKVVDDDRILVDSMELKALEETMLDDEMVALPNEPVVTRDTSCYSVVVTVLHENLACSRVDDVYHGEEQDATVRSHISSDDSDDSSTEKTPLDDLSEFDRLCVHLLSLICGSLKNLEQICCFPVVSNISSVTQSSVALTTFEWTDDWDLDRQSFLSLIAESMQFLHTSAGSSWSVEQKITTSQFLEENLLCFHKALYKMENIGDTIRSQLLTLLTQTTNLFKSCRDHLAPVDDNGDNLCLIGRFSADVDQWLLDLQHQCSHTHPDHQDVLHCRTLDIDNIELQLDKFLSGSRPLSVSHSQLASVLQLLRQLVGCVRDDRLEQHVSGSRLLHSHQFEERLKLLASTDAVWCVLEACVEHAAQWCDNVDIRLVNAALEMNSQHAKSTEIVQQMQVLCTDVSYMLNTMPVLIECLWRRVGAHVTTDWRALRQCHRRLLAVGQELVQLTHRSLSRELLSVAIAADLDQVDSFIERSTVVQFSDSTLDDDQLNSVLEFLLSASAMQLLVLRYCHQFGVSAAAALIPTDSALVGSTHSVVSSDLTSGVSVDALKTRVAAAAGKLQQLEDSVFRSLSGQQLRQLAAALSDSSAVRFSTSIASMQAYVHTVLRMCNQLVENSESPLQTDSSATLLQSTVDRLACHQLRRQLATAADQLHALHDRLQPLSDSVPGICRHVLALEFLHRHGVCFAACSASTPMLIDDATASACAVVGVDSAAVSYRRMPQLLAAELKALVTAAHQLLEEYADSVAVKDVCDELSSLQRRVDQLLCDNEPSAAAVCDDCGAAVTSLCAFVEHVENMRSIAAHTRCETPQQLQDLANRLKEQETRLESLSSAIETPLVAVTTIFQSECEKLRGDAREQLGAIVRHYCHTADSWTRLDQLLHEIAAPAHPIGEALCEWRERLSECQQLLDLLLAGQLASAGVCEQLRSSLVAAESAFSDIGHIRQQHQLLVYEQQLEQLLARSSSCRPDDEGGLLEQLVSYLQLSHGLTELLDHSVTVEDELDSGERFFKRCEQAIRDIVQRYDSLLSDCTVQQLIHHLSDVSPFTKLSVPQAGSLDTAVIDNLYLANMHALLLLLPLRVCHLLRAISPSPLPSPADQQFTTVVHQLHVCLQQLCQLRSCWLTGGCGQLQLLADVRRWLRLANSVKRRLEHVPVSLSQLPRRCCHLDDFLQQLPVGGRRLRQLRRWFVSWPASDAAYLSELSSADGRLANTSAGAATWRSFLQQQVLQAVEGSERMVAWLQQDLQQALAILQRVESTAPADWPAESSHEVDLEQEHVDALNVLLSSAECRLQESRSVWLSAQSIVTVQDDWLHRRLHRHLSAVLLILRVRQVLMKSDKQHKVGDESPRAFSYDHVHYADDVWSAAMLTPGCHDNVLHSSSGFQLSTMLQTADEVCTACADLRVRLTDEQSSLRKSVVFESLPNSSYQLHRQQQSAARVQQLCERVSRVTALSDLLLDLPAANAASLRELKTAVAACDRLRNRWQAVCAHAAESERLAAAGCAAVQRLNDSVQLASARLHDVCDTHHISGCADCINHCRACVLDSLAVCCRLGCVSAGAALVTDAATIVTRCDDYLAQCIAADATAEADIVADSVDSSQCAANASTVAPLRPPAESQAAVGLEDSVQDALKASSSLDNAAVEQHELLRCAEEQAREASEQLFSVLARCDRERPQHLPGDQLSDAMARCVAAADLLQQLSPAAAAGAQRCQQLVSCVRQMIRVEQLLSWLDRVIDEGDHGSSHRHAQLLGELSQRRSQLAAVCGEQHVHDSVAGGAALAGRLALLQQRWTWLEQRLPVTDDSDHVPDNCRDTDGGDAVAAAAGGGSGGVLVACGRVLRRAVLAALPVQALLLLALAGLALYPACESDCSPATAATGGGAVLVASGGAARAAASSLRLVLQHTNGPPPI